MLAKALWKLASFSVWALVPVAWLFKVKVQMTCSPQGKGKISIPFSNEDELEYVMNIIDKVKG